MVQGITMFTEQFFIGTSFGFLLGILSQQLAAFILFTKKQELETHKKETSEEILKRVGDILSKQKLMPVPSLPKLEEIKPFVPPLPKFETSSKKEIKPPEPEPQDDLFDDDGYDGGVSEFGD